MNNPWELIDIEAYEKHMSSSEVYQLQMLNSITREQLQDNDQSLVGILGAASGNGLLNIDLSQTQRVYAIDINEKYLKVCKERYSGLGDTLETLKLDLSDAKVVLPSTKLLICNLIIEYLGEEQFISMIDRNKDKLGVVSCVIQRNLNNSFVSTSELTSHFDPIVSIHHDINENKLKFLFLSIGFKCIKHKEYTLPNGKEFIRLDFSQ